MNKFEQVSSLDHQMSSAGESLYAWGCCRVVSLYVGAGEGLWLGPGGAGVGGPVQC